jgi:hypothetical protein
MEWHLNDLSLIDQVKSSEGLKQLIQELIKLRLQRADVGRLVYCSRGLLGTTIMGRSNVRQAIEATGDRDFIGAAMRWFANAGPFWDDSRQVAADDLFYWNEEEVQETGLGEAARRRIVGTDARVFSFVSPGSLFDIDKLEIVHGLLEAPVGHVVVPNARSIAELKELPLAALNNWIDVLAAASARNPNLWIADDVSVYLRPRPFNSAVATKLLELLAVLDTLSANTTKDSALTEEGRQIYQRFFVGEEAPFSSEDPIDKNVFKFRDPESGVKTYCPWHGKINIGDPFRFHYEWPRPKNQTRIKVLYMGQKLTKL